jgi:hypothetical protein
MRGLKRYALLIVVVGVLGALAGAKALPNKIYTSTAVVQVHDGLVNLATPLGSSPPNMSTEQQVATGYDVLAVAADGAPEHPAVSTFQNSGKVTVPLNSTALVFTYSAKSATEAQDGALAWANAYLSQRTDALGSKVAVQSRQAAKRRDSIESDVRTLQRQESLLTPGTLPYTQIQTQLRGRNSELTSSQRSINQLAQTDIDAGQLIGGPQRPKAPTGISTPLGLLLGGATGLFLGVALALIAERFSRKVRDGHDLARATSIGVWGVLSPGGADAQLQIEALGARLALLARRHHVRSLLVTGLSDRYDDLATSLSSAIDRLGVEVVNSDDIESLLAPSAGESAEGGDALLVVDGPPVLVDPRTAVYSAEANVTLLVVRHHSSTVEDVRAAVQRIAAAGGSATGVVMVTRGGRRFLRAFKASSTQHTSAAALAMDAGGGDRRTEEKSESRHGRATQTPSTEDEAAETSTSTPDADRDDSLEDVAARNGAEVSHWTSNTASGDQVDDRAQGSVPIKRKGSSSASRGPRRPRG